MTRYHPSLVVMHWLMAILIVPTLLLGGVIPLNIHILSGLLIAGILVIRLVLKLSNDSPAPQRKASKLVARLARLMHCVLYILTFAVVISGIGMAIKADLFPLLIGGGQLPADFLNLPIRTVHDRLTNLLLAAIAFHALAALLHQFVLKDQLFARIWFKPRN